jgi:hypothetical protein
VIRCGPYDTGRTSTQSTENGTVQRSPAGVVRAERPLIPTMNFHSLYLWGKCQAPLKADTAFQQKALIILLKFDSVRKSSKPAPPVNLKPTVYIEIQNRRLLRIWLKTGDSKPGSFTSCLTGTSQKRRFWFEIGDSSTLMVGKSPPPVIAEVCRLRYTTSVAPYVLPPSQLPPPPRCRSCCCRHRRRRCHHHHHHQGGRRNQASAASHGSAVPEGAVVEWPR